MKKFFEKFKSIIIVLLIIPMLMFSYNEQRASVFVDGGVVVKFDCTIGASGYPVVCGVQAL